MANTGNLKSYEKGQSGNPNGRPKGSRNVSTVLAGMLEEIAPDSVVDASFIREIAKTVNKPTIADAAAARIVYEGIVKGQPWALKELSDRTEGKARQALEITNKPDLDKLAAVLNASFANSRKLHTEYGVPMPSTDELNDMVEDFAQANGVDVRELAGKVVMLP